MLSVCQELVLGTFEPEDKGEKGGQNGIKIGDEVGWICLILIAKANALPGPCFILQSGKGPTDCSPADTWDKVTSGKGKKQKNNKKKHTGEKKEI